MSRYSHYPRWMLFTKAAVLAFALPVIVYLQLCQWLSLHYSAQVDRYGDAAIAISSGWPDLVNFDEAHKCECNRLLAAEGDAASYRPFDAWWMIRNWHTDFLAKQPPCTR